MDLFGCLTSTEDSEEDQDEEIEDGAQDEDIEAEDSTVEDDGKGSHSYCGFIRPNESSLQQISRKIEDKREIQTGHTQHSENFPESLPPTNWTITDKKNSKAMKLDVLTLMRRQKEHSLGILPLHQLCLEFIRFFCIHSFLWYLTRL